MSSQSARRVVKKSSLEPVTPREQFQLSTNLRLVPADQNTAAQHHSLLLPFVDQERWLGRVSLTYQCPTVTGQGRPSSKRLGCLVCSSGHSKWHRGAGDTWVPAESCTSLVLHHSSQTLLLCPPRLGASFVTYRKESGGTWSMCFVKLKHVCLALGEVIMTWPVVLREMGMHQTTAAESVVITCTEWWCSVHQNRESRSHNCVYPARLLVFVSVSDTDQAGFPRNMKMRL